MNSLNIFDYATKELSQDAFICWLLAQRENNSVVKLNSNRVSFYKDECSKLRVNIKDNDGVEYNMKVSSKLIRDFWEKNEKDIDILNKEFLSKSEKVHLRIGLARAFSLKDNHCYLMLNGLFLI